MRRAALIAGALVCLALAAAVFLLAADVARWRASLAAGDVRYRMTPEEGDLWQPAALVPLGLGREALGVGDDVAWRRAVRAFRLSRLDEQFDSDAELTLLRNEARARLLAIAEGGDDPRRRSNAANLLGVLSLAAAASETQDRALLLQNAVAAFEDAIELDPANDEAKHNLELALQRGRGIQIAEGSGGPNPLPGGSGAAGAGAGDPGSGY